MDFLSDLFRDAKAADSKTFRELIAKTKQIMSTEKTNATKMRIASGLVHMQSFGEATIVGDLHGDIDSLRHILNESRFAEKASCNLKTCLIFLGDYGDRGLYSAEVYYVVLILKTMFPDQVVLLMGNHEGPEDLLASPHDLPHHLLKKFGSEGQIVYDELCHLFRRFYTAIVVEDRCVMLHGGVPSKARSLKDVAHAFEKHPSESHLEEILWSDPYEGKGIIPSVRGAGFLFGSDLTDRFLKMLGVRFLIRGHEPVEEGYKISHEGRILTLFSRKGSPYFNQNGAFLTFDLSKIFDSAWHLVPFIHKF